MTLSEFLLARFAEDEADANSVQHEIGRWHREKALNGPDGRQGSIVLTGIFGTACDPARVLAECKAKRRIVELHTPTGNDTLIARPGETVEELKARWAVHVEEDVPTTCPTCVFSESQPCPTLRYLALPYADHSEFQEEWR